MGSVDALGKMLASKGKLDARQTALATNGIANLLEDPDPYVRISVIEVLPRTSYDKALLTRQLHNIAVYDPYPGVSASFIKYPVRREARTALSQLDGK